MVNLNLNSSQPSIERAIAMLDLCRNTYSAQQHRNTHIDELCDERWCKQHTQNGKLNLLVYHKEEKEGLKKIYKQLNLHLSSKKEYRINSPSIVPGNLLCRYKNSSDGGATHSRVSRLDGMRKMDRTKSGHSEIPLLYL